MCVLCVCEWVCGGECVLVYICFFNRIKNYAYTYIWYVYVLSIWNTCVIHVSGIRVLAVNAWDEAVFPCGVWNLNWRWSQTFIHAIYVLRYTSLESLFRGESVRGCRFGETKRSRGRESYSQYELYDRRINKIKKIKLHLIKTHKSPLYDIFWQMKRMKKFPQLLS